VKACQGVAGRQAGDRPSALSHLRRLRVCAFAQAVQLLLQDILLLLCKVGARRGRAGLALRHGQLRPHALGLLAQLARALGRVRAHLHAAAARGVMWSQHKAGVLGFLAPCTPVAWVPSPSGCHNGSQLAQTAPGR